MVDGAVVAAVDRLLLGAEGALEELQRGVGVAVAQRREDVGSQLSVMRVSPLGRV